MLRVANGGGEHPARNIVGGDFLSLVRLGLRDPHDPIIVDSLAVIDAVIKYDLPQGPCWQRYNHDGYGQHADGAAFDGAGVGGAWPLLTGERGHYELEAGRDPLPFIKTLERFANFGGMLPEQVWCRDELARFKPGLPTGSAMPLSMGARGIPQPCRQPRRRRLIRSGRARAPALCQTARRVRH